MTLSRQPTRNPYGATPLIRLEFSWNPDGSWTATAYPIAAGATPRPLRITLHQYHGREAENAIALRKLADFMDAHARQDGQ